jgi:phenylalanyl-tRNA synthetase alpha chain
MLVEAQLLDLSPYRPVSSQPPIRRDLSVAVNEDETPEDIGDRVRSTLRERSTLVESVEVLTQTPYEELPAAAVGRLGISPGQKNVLVRVVLRDLERALTHEEANELRDEIYAIIHRGTVWYWASGPGQGA